jgi:hypothetical protein
MSSSAPCSLASSTYVVPCGQTDGRTDRYDVTESLFAILWNHLKTTHCNLKFPAFLSTFNSHNKLRLFPQEKYISHYNGHKLCSLCEVDVDEILAFRIWYFSGVRKAQFSEYLRLSMYMMDIEIINALQNQFSCLAMKSTPSEQSANFYEAKPHHIP